MEVGKAIHENTLKNSLRSLNPGIHFDMGAALNIYHPKIEKWQGVFYEGRHLCSMDRGMIPEFKVWQVIEAPIEIDPQTVGSIDGAWLTWRTIDPADPEYISGIHYAQTYANGYAIEGDKLKHYRGFRIGKTRGDILKLGWRHTIERILLRNVPNITRDVVAVKLGVDMNLFPIGSIEAVQAAIYEE